MVDYTITGDGLINFSNVYAIYVVSLHLEISTSFRLQLVDCVVIFHFDEYKITAFN